MTTCKITKNVSFQILLLTTYLCLNSVLVGAAGYTQTGLNNQTKVFTKSVDMQESDWTDPVELERTWQAALVRIPKLNRGYIKTTIKKLAKKNSPVEGVWPTVIYLHGCTGIWDGTYARINFLAKNGYAVIAPTSFARKKYPISCEPSTHKGGLYRPTLIMRQNDAGHAIAKAKTLPWVNKADVFLMGLSQGGITTATFSSQLPIHTVKARIVEGWTCNAGWGEYRGINAPASEPVLTLVASKDPWFQNSWNRGSCEAFLNKLNGSKSVVFSKGFLSTQHELLNYRKPKKTVLEFIRLHTSQATPPD